MPSLRKRRTRRLWSIGLPPVSSLLGPASLFYPLNPVAAGPVLPNVERESVEQVNALLASVSSEELDESGVNRLTGRVFVLRSAQGVPVAVSGYRPWPAGIAHLCVLTTRRTAAPAWVKRWPGPRSARPSWRAVCRSGGLDWSHRATSPKSSACSSSARS